MAAECGVFRRQWGEVANLHLSHVQGEDTPNKTAVIRRHWETSYSLQLSGLQGQSREQHGLVSWNLIKGAPLQSDIAGYVVSEILAKENKPFGDKKNTYAYAQLQTFYS